MAAITGDGVLRQEVRPTPKGYAAYIKSAAWHVRRLGALEAAGQRCQICYSPDELQVHHRTYARFRNEHPSDLTVLCADCHHLFHGRLATERTGRATAADDRWDRACAWVIGELQSAVNGALDIVGVEHDVTGRFGPLVRELLETTKRVDRRIGKMITQQQAVNARLARLPE